MFIFFKFFEVKKMQNNEKSNYYFFFNFKIMKIKI